MASKRGVTVSYLYSWFKLKFIKPGLYAYSNTGTPQLILFLVEDALLPRKMLRLIHLLLQTVLVLVVYFVLAVCTHVQAYPRLLLVYCFSGIATATIHLGGEGCHCCRLGGDRSCKLLHHCLDLAEFLVGSCSHRACRILSGVDEDGLAIPSGLKLYDALSLCVEILFESRSVVH